MPLDDYLVGLAWFALSSATVVAATALVVRRRLGHLSGEPRALAIFLIAVGVLALEHLVPLALGVLTRATPSLTGLLLCLALLRLPRREARTPAGPPPAPPSPLSHSVLAALGIGAAATAIVAYAGAVAVQPFTHIDVVNFHLPNLARWIQSRSVWQIDQFLPYQAQGNYPNTGDLIQLAAALPWHNDFAVRWVGLPFVVMTAVAVYALARELGAPTASAALFGAVAVTIPSVAVGTIDFELPDTIMYATFVSGVVFLLRYVRTRDPGDLLLAGLGLGLAFGVKWYAVTSVAVVVAVWGVGMLLARRPRRRVLADGALLGGVILACGGFWLVRNLVESGNPVFPQRIAPLGISIFDAPYDRYRELAGFSLAEYLGEPAVWRRRVLPAFHATLGAAWIVGALGLVAAVVAAAVRRSGARDRDWRVLGTAVTAVLLAAVYVATPYSALGAEGDPSGVQANTRYVVPAVLLGLGLAAWLAGRLGRAGIVVPFAGVVAVADGIRRDFEPVEARHVLLAGAALGAAAAAGWAWVALRRRPGWRHPPRVALGAAGCALALGIVTPAGYALERRFNDHRYRVVEAPLAWARDGGERRIGLAGLWDVNGLSPVLPAFGPRLGNRVEFVGRFRREMLHEHQRADPFVEDLRRGRYDLLVVGRALLPGTPRGDLEGWARAAGYDEVARTHRLVLFRRRDGTGR
jgi:hypothetical protein